MKKNKSKTITISFSLIIISLIIAVYLYPQMPDKVASHWNASGNVDGYMGKFWGLFLMPIVSAAILLLFLFIPKIDPLKKNIEKFRTYFDNFILLIIGFLFYIYLLTLAWNLGYTYSMNIMILPAVAALFYYISILMEKAKRNWFVGIRTPWTLSSDKVWNKTHKLGSKLFKILAVVYLLTIFFHDYMVFLILIPTFAVTIYLIVYSYLEYRKQKKQSNF
ncbi:MAG: SdpI family protein [Candidatus Aenigmarchaeota archaeon]|nr:SdpI family protein [Candidatus Aenigmarchaeota archaeon]